jgi:CheY-like chemotaxis protein
MTAFEVPTTALLEFSDRLRLPVAILGIAKSGIWVQAPEQVQLEFRSTVRVTFPNESGAIGALMEVVHASDCGIGLEITATADELLRGLLGDWSEGRTAVLSFDPRKTTAAESVPATEDIKARRRQLEGKCVLVVEDDSAVARVLHAMLSRQGGMVHVAEDGVTAVHIMKSRHFDAVLLDWMLPKMGGARVLDELRKVHPNLPVAVVSGMVQSAKMRSEVRRLGADAVFPKPFALSQISDWILRTIRDAA